MRSLLDVNVLLALFDSAHAHHESAHVWFERQRERGWASCPLTENGFVRVVSSPKYKGNRTTLRDAVHRLGAFTAATQHEFWADSLSIRDQAVFEPKHVKGPGQITDAYLLALATHHGGRLATYDRGIQLSSVGGAKPEHLELLGGA